MVTNFFQETYILFKRSVAHTLRNPVWVFISLFQPLLYLFLFMPLLKSLGGVPGLPAGQTVTVFIPGLLVMLALYGSTFVGFGFISEIREGVIDRFLVAPISRTAILLGPILRDVLVLLVQCILLIVVAIPFGLSVSPLGLLLSLILFALIAVVMASMSYAFAIMFKSEDQLAPTLQTIILPVTLLSGITLPLALAPGWLQKLAYLNPFSHAVDAARALFMGNIISTDVLRGFIAVTLLALLNLWWARNALHKMSS